MEKFDSSLQKETMRLRLGQYKQAIKAVITLKYNTVERSDSTMKQDENK